MSRLFATGSSHKKSPCKRTAGDLQEELTEIVSGEGFESYSSTILSIYIILDRGMIPDLTELNHLFNSIHLIGYVNESNRT